MSQVPLSPHNGKKNIFHVSPTKCFCLTWSPFSRSTDDKLKKGLRKNEPHRTLGEEILTKCIRKRKVKMIEILSTPILWFETNSEVTLPVKESFPLDKLDSQYASCSPLLLCTYVCINCCDTNLVFTSKVLPLVDYFTFTVIKTRPHGSKCRWGFLAC